MYTYDTDGWYSGDNEGDSKAGRVTELEPDVSGGQASRFVGSEWTYPYPVQE